MSLSRFEAELNDLIEGISEALAHKARAGLRRQLIELITAAASDPHAGMPLLMDEDEIARLHDIAFNAALQTGAKGLELDQITSRLFRALAAFESRKAAEHMSRRLRVVT